MSDHTFFPILIALSFLTAGTVKGITGMGLPTVAMGILGAFTSPTMAAALLLIPSLVTNVWQMLAGKSLAILVRRFGLMLACVVIGTVMGVAWALLGGAVVYGVLKATVGLRLSQEEEYDGADLSIHKISATPDREVSW